MESRGGGMTHGRLVTASDAATTEAPPPVPVVGESSAWAPLRQRAFRWLWLGVLISSIGTVMQTVGAQWLLVDAPNAAALVALVQAANTLPVMLLALKLTVFAAPGVAIALTLPAASVDQFVCRVPPLLVFHLLSPWLFVHQRLPDDPATKS